MNFLERIKDQMEDPRRSRGGGPDVTVSTQALRELIHHFESLDSEMRVIKASGSESLYQRLSDTITALFHSTEKNGETVIVEVMETLGPLLKKKRKERPIRKMY